MNIPHINDNFSYFTGIKLCTSWLNIVDFMYYFTVGWIEYAEMFDTGNDGNCWKKH